TCALRSRCLCRARRQSTCGSSRQRSSTVCTRVNGRNQVSIAATGKRVIWKPQPGPQLEFHRRAEFEVLYGGSRGGGKTDSLIVEALRHIDKPEYTAIFFRRTYPQLRQVIRRARRLIPQVAPGAEWRAAENSWIFPSGATLTFAHLQHEESTDHYQGHEYHYVAIDELTHLTERMYLDILATCRSTVPGIRPRLR